MVEFETISSREIEFDNNFIQVAKKRAIDEERTNTFYSLTRGFFSEEGERRYKKNFAIPDDGETVHRVRDALDDLVDEMEGDQETLDEADESEETEQAEEEPEEAEIEIIDQDEMETGEQDTGQQTLEE